LSHAAYSQIKIYSNFTIIREGNLRIKGEGKICGSKGRYTGKYDFLNSYNLNLIFRKDYDWVDGQVIAAQ
jgi:hypothetical protein